MYYLYLLAICFLKVLKFFILSLRFLLYFCFADCVSLVTVLVDLGGCWRLLKAWLWYSRKDCRWLCWSFSSTLNGYQIAIELMMADVNFFLFFKKLAVVWHSINSSSSIFEIFKKWYTDCRRIWHTIVVSSAIKYPTPSRHDNSRTEYANKLKKVTK